MDDAAERNDRRGLDGDNSDAAPSGKRAEKPAPIDLEPADEPPRAEREVTPPRPPDEGRDRCPECGAAMDPSDDICIRCGKRTKPPAAVNTPASDRPPPERDEPDAAAETPAGPISAPTTSPALDLWAPVFLVGAAILILVVAHLAGAIGLFPRIRVTPEVTDVPWGTRFTELLRVVILLVFWTGCGIAGLLALSVLLERQFGDAQLAAIRVAAIMATIRLSTLIAIPGPRWIEWMTETIIQAGGFILLSMLFFRLAIRNAALLAGCTLMAIFLLWLFSFAVHWALGAV